MIDRGFLCKVFGHRWKFEIISFDKVWTGHWMGEEKCYKQETYWLKTCPRCHEERRERT